MQRLVLSGIVYLSIDPIWADDDDAKIRTSEETIERLYTKLKADGFTTADVRARLNDPEFLKEAFERHLEFHQALETYLDQKLSIVIDETLSEILELHRLYPDLALKVDTVKSAHQSWQKLHVRKRFRASERNKIVRNFFIAAAAVYAEIEAKFLPPPTYQYFKFQRTLKTLKRWTGNFGTLVALSPWVGWVLLKYAITGDKKFATPGSHPLTPGLSSFARALSTLRRHRFKVNAPSLGPAPAGSLDLYVASHRDIYLDPVMMGHVVRNYRMFMAPNRYFPKVKGAGLLLRWIERGARTNADLLPVGEDATKDSEAVVETDAGLNQLIDLLSPTKPNRAVIYPEGTTSLIGETAPLPLSFQRRILQSLIKANVNFRLILVSNDIHPGLRAGPAERLDRLFSTGQRSIQINLSAPWTKEEIEKLSSHMHGAQKLFLSYLIRSEWIESLPTNDRFLFGQLRLNALRQNVRDFIGRRMVLGSPDRCLGLLRLVSGNLKAPYNEGSR